MTKSFYESVLEQEAKEGPLPVSRVRLSISTADSEHDVIVEALDATGVTYIYDVTNNVELSRAALAVEGYIPFYGYKEIQHAISQLAVFNSSAS